MSSFFHTLVVVGAGLSLANCGGESRSDGHTGGSGNSGTSGGSAGDATGGTSMGGSGGIGIGTGGTLSLGGTLSSGGTGGIPRSFGGGAPWGGMAGMPTTQWSCDTQAAYCNTGMLGGQSVDAVGLDEPCAIDPSRPVSPADCAAGEEFQCTLATLEEQTLLVNCACSDSGQSCNCAARYSACSGDVSEPCVSLCGCARTCIVI